MNQEQLDSLKASMRRYYEAWAPKYDDFYKGLGRYAEQKYKADRRDVLMIEEAAIRFAQGWILDLACGSGFFTKHLASFGTDVVALDYSWAMLDLNVKTLKEVSLFVKYVRGDAFFLPFKDAVFDRCFLGYLLSHIPSEEMAGFFADLRRVLKPHARILIADDAWTERNMEQCPNKVGIQERTLADASYYRVYKHYYEATELGSLLSNYGLGLVSWRVGRLSFVAEAVVHD